MTHEVETLAILYVNLLHFVQDDTKNSLQL